MRREIKYCWCGTIAEGTTEQCASHNAADRKQERQANKMKVVTPVKKVSQKRAVQNIEYLKIRREYLELYPVCEVPECDLKAVDIHHQKGRQEELLLESKYFMSVCRKHH